MKPKKLYEFIKSYWPNRQQWQKWSLPNKLTAIGTYLAILSMFLSGAGLMLGITPIDNANSDRLPSDTAVQGTLNLCAAGRVQKVRGNLERALQKWKENAVISGESKISDLGGIISEIKDDKVKSKVYELYIDCVKDTLPRFLKKSETPTPHYAPQTTTGDRNIQIQGSSVTLGESESD